MMITISFEEDQPVLLKHLLEEFFSKNVRTIFKIAFHRKNGLEVQIGLTFSYLILNKDSY